MSRYKTNIYPNYGNYPSFTYTITTLDRRQNKTQTKTTIPSWHDRSHFRVIKCFLQDKVFVELKYSVFDFTMWHSCACSIVLLLAYGRGTEKWLFNFDGIWDREMTSLLMELSLTSSKSSPLPQYSSDPHGLSRERREEPVTCEPCEDCELANVGLRSKVNDRGKLAYWALCSEKNTFRDSLAIWRPS